MDGTELRAIRLSMGLTQHELEDLLGYAPQTISHMERGRMTMTLAFTKSLQAHVALTKASTHNERQEGRIAGETLRSIRTRMDLTQQEFADLLGYKNKTISEMETGKLRIIPSFAKYVASVFTHWQIQKALHEQTKIEATLQG